MSPEYLHKEFC